MGGAGTAGQSAALKPASARKQQQQQRPQQAAAVSAASTHQPAVLMSVSVKVAADAAAWPERWIAQGETWEWASKLQSTAAADDRQHAWKHHLHQDKQQHDQGVAEPGKQLMQPRTAAAQTRAVANCSGPAFVVMEEWQATEDDEELRELRAGSSSLEYNSTALGSTGVEGLAEQQLQQSPEDTPDGADAAKTEGEDAHVILEQAARLLNDLDQFLGLAPQASRRC